jgi:hypothetical protein
MRSPLLLRVVFSDTLPHPALRRMLHEHRLRDERQRALLDLRELVDKGLVRAEGTTKNRRYVLAGHDQP